MAQAAAPTETSTRPPPGLARGTFAAKESYFYGVLGVTALVVVLVLLRHRLLRLLRKPR